MFENKLHENLIILYLCAQHDPEMCTPGGEDGNFIMFARATSGDKKNNNHFSPCSLKSINPVLNFKARSPKGCFTGTCGKHGSSLPRNLKFSSLMEHITLLRGSLI